MKLLRDVKSRWPLLGIILLLSPVTLDFRVSACSSPQQAKAPHKRRKKVTKRKSSQQELPCGQAIQVAGIESVAGANAVIVQVEIDENGKVISAEAISGEPALRQRAVAEVKKKLFPPKRLGGKPVKTTALITYKFEDLSSVIEPQN